tara:strand:+ start:1517 stop:1735 length:219 start_codon:yes stop_codon:yes gene_type:complete
MSINKKIDSMESRITILESNYARFTHYITLLTALSAIVWTVGTWYVEYVEKEKLKAFEGRYHKPQNCIGREC